MLKVGMLCTEGFLSTDYTDCSKHLRKLWIMLYRSTSARNNSGSSNNRETED